MFQQLTHISENLIINNEVLLDDLFVDVGAFKKEAGMEKGETFPYIEVRT